MKIKITQQVLVKGVEKFPGDIVEVSTYEAHILMGMDRAKAFIEPVQPVEEVPEQIIEQAPEQIIESSKPEPKKRGKKR